MKLRSSHVLCKVADISAAVRDFTGQGFTVTWGSRPDKAHNALLWFPEGPFVELFELPARAAVLRWPVGLRYGAPAGQRIAAWARSAPGWADLALETDAQHLRAEYAELSRLDLPVSRILKGRRTNPDGSKVGYQFLAPAPAGLPFIVSSYDPPQRPAEIAHPNGAKSVARIRFGVAAQDRAGLEALIGPDPWLDVVPAEQTGVQSVELNGAQFAGGL
ncbi:hypothetical protein HPO96_09650 [Kribbella sandramycini]|uniref:Glyoxalase-like domain-containing protein n=2 Tax=Kribbella sandramycini TaxID=60450 RepID=A0A7Y4KXJ9_9ACTN|nr:VOC family protein [Kribbella sandramycini]MBB6569660.1 hypothetical protein [Kribbella sandramycini]NOL40508.1 hypothetical protein [Kribbella sandramycini]